MGGDAQLVFDDFVRRLKGRPVSYAGLLLNSLRICVDRRLQEEIGFFLWLEPTWHLGGPSGVLVGSRQAQVEEPEAHAALNSIVQGLESKVIEEVSVEPLTHDLELRFSDGCWARTFVADPDAEENWYIRDCRLNIVVSGSARGLHLTERAKPAE